MKTNYNKLIAAFFGVAFLMTSCSKNDKMDLIEPEVAMSIQDKELELSVGEHTTFSTTNKNN